MRIHNHELQDINILRHERPHIERDTGHITGLWKSLLSIHGKRFQHRGKAIALESATKYDWFGGGWKLYPILQV